MRNPTVIFITHVVPYPPAAGNEIRILKLIKWLKARGYRIVLILNVESLDPIVREGLEKIVDWIHCRGEEVRAIERPEMGSSFDVLKAFVKKIINRASEVFGSTNSEDAEYKKKSDRVKKSLCPEKLVQMTSYYCSRYKPAAVIAEYIFTAPCLDIVPPGTLKLIDTHDMFSRKKEQVLSFGVEEVLYCTPSEERNHLLKGDVVIAIQSDEAKMFEQLVRKRKVVTVGIDYEVVSDIDNSLVTPGRVLVVGSDNPLNVHGLKEFHRNAWPLIRKAHPTAVLRVIGKLGRKFQTDDPSVEIAGWVESLDDEYKRACVVVNPTVAGTGLKIKCVEALCRAKPLVATPNSVEGLSFKGEPPFIVCGNWEEFSSAVNRLLGSRDKRLELQTLALHFAREHFSTECVYAELAPFFPHHQSATESRTGHTAREHGKLRIAVWHNLPTGGGKRQLYNHVKGLVERGHYVEAWCPDTANSSFLSLNEIVQENVVPLNLGLAIRNSSSKDFETVKRLVLAMEKHCEMCAEEINKGEFDVLFANSCLFFRTTPIAKFVDIPTVLYLGEPYRSFYEALPHLPWIAPRNFIDRDSSPRDDFSKLDGIRLQARQELEFAKAFDVILVNSRFSRESVLRSYGLESKVCYLGIDVEQYKPSGELKENYVIGVGYIYHAKGIDRAIRAVASVPKEKRPSLVWVGDNASQNDLKKYNELARDLDVNFSVKIHIPEEEMISLLSRARAMIYTSRLEPFGLAPLEANACGTPVIGIAEGGVKETIQNGVNGFLADDDDPRSLGELICKFMDDPDLSLEMGARARDHVREKWNMDICTSNIESYLTRLAKEDAANKLREFLKNTVFLQERSAMNEIRMNIDDIKAKDGKLHMYGWAYIDDGKGSNNAKIYAVVQDRIFPTEKMLRKDVTKHFGDKINYDYSGFRVDVKTAENDARIGILIERQGKIAFRYIEK